MKTATNVVRAWETDFGSIILPDDFPSHALTKSGWYDRRFKIFRDMKAYIEDFNQKILSGASSTIRGSSFTEWCNARK
jgi:hypothetical protein